MNLLSIKHLPVLFRLVGIGVIMIGLNTFFTFYIEYAINVGLNRKSEEEIEEEKKEKEEIKK